MSQPINILLFFFFFIFCRSAFSQGLILHQLQRYSLCEKVLRDAVQVNRQVCVRVRVLIIDFIALITFFPCSPLSSSSCHLLLLLTSSTLQPHLSSHLLFSLTSHPHTFRFLLFFTVSFSLNSLPPFLYSSPPFFFVHLSPLPLSPTLVCVLLLSFPLLSSPPPSSPLLSSVRLMMCGTVWARCCRLREMLQLPPSVSSPPWSWRPAAPSCPSPSYPEHYETHTQLQPQYCSAAAQMMDLHTAHTPYTHTACLHATKSHLHKVLLPYPQKHTLYRNANCTNKHSYMLSQTFPQCLAVQGQVQIPGSILDSVLSQLKCPRSLGLGFNKRIGTGFRLSIMLLNLIPTAVVV